METWQILQKKALEILYISKLRNCQIYMGIIYLRQPGMLYFTAQGCYISREILYFNGWQKIPENTGNMEYPHPLCIKIEWATVIGRFTNNISQSLVGIIVRHILRNQSTLTSTNEVVFSHLSAFVCLFAK